MLCIKSVFLPVNYSEVYRYKYIDSRNTIPIVRTADPDMEFLEGEKRMKVFFTEEPEFAKDLVFEQETPCHYW